MGAYANAASGGHVVRSRPVTDPLPYAEGYFAHLSYEPGDPIDLHCGATLPRPSGRVAPAGDALAFDLEIARLGATRDVVYAAHGLTAEPHPIPDDTAATGAGWPAAHRFMAGDWASGWYEARLLATRPDGTPADSRAGFVLRAPTGRPRSPILIELALNTWNAYNDWGRSNLYLGGTTVSFRRPFARGFLDRPDPLAHRNANIAREPDLGGDAWLQHARTNAISSWSACAGWPTWEGPFIAWAEGAGYRFDYAANADLEERPAVLDGHRLMLSIGHDEYWSSPMRDTVEAHIAAGGHVAFLSGNTSFWQVRLEDGGARMVSYKDRARVDDPIRHTDPARLTSMWCDPRIGRPEAAMTGVSFSRGGYARQAGCTPRGPRGYTVWRPEHWLFAGTDLRYGDTLGDEHCVVGYECDGVEMGLEDGLPVPTHADGCPEGFEILGSAPARLYSVEPDKGVNEYPTGLAAMRTVGELQGLAHALFGSPSPENVRRLAHGHAVLGTYTSGGGGVVVTSGCTDWAYGVAGGDPLVQRVTRNLLDRLGNNGGA
jgi:hypothetical protein